MCDKSLCGFVVRGSTEVKAIGSRGPRNSATRARDLPTNFIFRPQRKSIIRRSFDVYC